MSEMVYKIARASEWEPAEGAGIFAGSADDKRDGFIHLSSADQVRTTHDRYFSGENNLLLVAVNAERLGPALKWEVSRRGEKYPHFYGPLPLTAVHSAVAIRRGSEGRPIFPPEIP